MLTVSACKGAGIWPLDSQLETEIYSFSQSPPPGVSKYHRGPFDQRPQGPWRRSQSFDLHFGSFFANFQSAVALSVSCWDGSFSVWSHQTWPTRRPILKNWAIWKFLLINLFQLSFSQKRDNGGVPPTLLRCPSAFWVSFGPLETNSLSSGWSNAHKGHLSSSAGLRLLPAALRSERKTDFPRKKFTLGNRKLGVT